MISYFIIQVMIFQRKITIKKKVQNDKRPFERTDIRTMDNDIDYWIDIIYS